MRVQADDPRLRGARMAREVFEIATGTPNLEYTPAVRTC
jgi:hypothetical protein